ncbi:MAG: hypothetical protein KDD55_01415, partial [Bdellovibrionales bacterium]|nr:hypothetical protein [Bdellovibrionales bacterium]
MAALEGASEEELRKANSRLKVAHSKIDPSDSEAVMEAQRVDFIDKYQIKIDEHQISFELGKTLRIDFLREAQALAQGLYGRNALWPERLKKWTKNERFNQTPDPYRSDNISIDRKDLQQEVQHWRMSQFHDLALAHVAHFVVTGEDLFDGDLVATVPGALFFHAQGLSVYYDEGE